MLGYMSAEWMQRFQTGRCDGQIVVDEWAQDVLRAPLPAAHAVRETSAEETARRVWKIVDRRKLLKAQILRPFVSLRTQKA